MVSFLWSFCIIYQDYDVLMTALFGLPIGTKQHIHKGWKWAVWSSYDTDSISVSPVGFRKPLKSAVKRKFAIQSTVAVRYQNNNCTCGKTRITCQIKCTATWRYNAYRLVYNDRWNAVDQLLVVNLTRL